MRNVVAGALSSVLLVACAGPTVYTPPVQTALQLPAGRMLLVAPLAAHPTPPLMLQTRYGMVAASSGFSADRVRAVDRELRALLAQSHVDVEDERDLGRTTPGAGAYLLRLEVAAYRESVSLAMGDIVACAVAGGLTFGFGALPCVSTRNSAVQSVEVEARLYAANGARAAEVPVNGHLESSVDVTDRRPIWHRLFRVELGVGYSVFGGTNAEFENEQDSRLAQLIFAQLAPMLAEGVSAPVPPDALGPPPSAIVATAPPLPPIPPAPAGDNASTLGSP